MAKKETNPNDKNLVKDEKIKIEDLSIFDLNQYQKVAELICSRYANYLQANSSTLAKYDVQRVTNIFMGYKDKHERIINELEKRLNNIE